jgi:RecB family exonuclease
MMETFLDEIARKVVAAHEGDHSKICLVFPTRRACLIFRTRLSLIIGKPVWSPKIMSIGDFVSTHSGHPISEEIDLLTTLYDVYKEYWPKHDFGRFYPWGNMLLGDFDEADKQVEDPVFMFRNIAELKKIDATFMPEVESLEFLKGFLKTMDLSKMTKLQKEFAENWNNLRHIYEKFQLQLTNKNLSYEGRTYRLFVEKIKRDIAPLPYSQIHFAGFHGFSMIEEKMIFELGTKIETKIWWDTDDAYLSDPLHEAGSYFRNSTITKTHPISRTNRIKIEDKSIEIISVPLLAGQAKLAGQIVKDLLNKHPERIAKTAIVLPDEKSLLPVLFAIPKEIDSLNVTMGFPLKQSPFASLIINLKKTAESSTKNNQGEWLYDRRIVRQLISHPLVMSSLSIRKPNPEIHEWRLTSRDIEAKFEFPDAGVLFYGLETSTEVFGYASSILRLFASNGKNRPEHENDILAYMASEIEKTAGLLKSHLSEIKKETAWIILRDLINAMRIPFSGEPIAGLQIMGFLETRALDFENVILLNVNEGILPAEGQQHSFIPFSLRKAFGLSTIQERESSYAYHFYRLLHRSKKVFIIHNSESGATGGGEPSRYIQQIIRELAPSSNSAIQLTHRAVAAPLETPNYNFIEIPKDDSVMESLQYYTKGSEHESRGALSSTALSTYINCPLQFYFKHVVKLREDTEESEKIDAAGFGIILHAVMEDLYKPFEGKIIHEQDVDELIKKSEIVVENVVDREFSTQYNQLQGTDVLTAEVIKLMVFKILKADRKSTPFQFEKTEGRFEASINIGDTAVKLVGIFDRIDQLNGQYRIIDYKTGNVELSAKSVTELFSSPKKKTLFQLYFYKLLYEIEYPGRNTVAGFYAMRQIKDGVSFPKEQITNEDMAQFKTNCQNMLNEIFDPNVPFKQTRDLTRCSYCPYVELCKR